MYDLGSEKLKGEKREEKEKAKEGKGISLFLILFLLFCTSSRKIRLLPYFCRHLSIKTLIIYGIYIRYQPRFDPQIGWKFI
jgi:hypothetical protein